MLVACVGVREAEGETGLEEPGDSDSRAVVSERRGKAVVAEVVARSRRGLPGGGEGGGDEEGIGKVVVLADLCVFICR